MAMGKLLWEVKGGGQGQAISKMDVQAAADGILQPLMDLLDGKRILLCLPVQWNIELKNTIYQEGKILCIFRICLLRTKFYVCHDLAI